MRSLAERVLESCPQLQVLVNNAGLFLLSPERGADTAVWLAGSPEVAGASGGYYVKRRLSEPSKAARDLGTAARLWQVSAELTAVNSRSG
ncbi:MAG: hypothetical protein ACC742_13270 [Thermoanaerobaculales bacterium]